MRIAIRPLLADPAIARHLEDFPGPVQAFAQELRAYLKAETRPAFELAGMSAQSFNVGYGFVRKAWDCYSAIIVYQHHINLSFPSGAQLFDREGLLQGTGARVRHLKIKHVEDLQTPAARDLLAQARENAWVLLEGNEPTHDGVQTFVRE